MNAQTQPAALAASSLNINLTDFIDEFGDELLESLNRSNPPVYTGSDNAHRQLVMDRLKRKPFAAQAEVVQAITALLLDRNEQAGIINAEMGTGKTMMAIAVAAVMHAAGYRRTLVVSPPHLVYKWRREILETIPAARVWVLNGPDTLLKLLKLRDQMGDAYDGRQEFFILGRVRMRMGFHWRLACWKKRAAGGQLLAACPDCGQVLEDLEGNLVTVEEFERGDRRRTCSSCRGALWTLIRPGKPDGGNRRATILKSMCRIPTIGPVRAERLLNDFGEDFLATMLVDNVSEFINLMDAKGDFVFSDRQAKRMERSMANIEFGFGEGGYQPTEFIKRQLPNGYFDLLVVDEGHEYKNSGSAQGQAMGVLAAKARKTVLLTGTLMGGYADDLFYLLFRILTQRMIEDGYRPNARGSMAPAAMSFMRDHGVLKDIYTERDGDSHKTARGKKLSVRTVKAPGFGPKGIHRFVLPFTVFLKLKDIGGNVLPDYQEEFVDVPMAPDQASAYQRLAATLTAELRQALARRDTTLLGVVLNVLLAWPDCCFRPEIVKHPRSRDTLAFVPAIFGDEQLMPKEQALVDLCLEEKAKGRKGSGIHRLQRDARHHVQAEESARAIRAEGGSATCFGRYRSTRGLDPRPGRSRHRCADHQPGAGEDRAGPAGLPDHRVPADGVQRVHLAAGRAAVVADRAEAPGAGGVLRLRRQLADHLLAVDGEEDRCGSEHVGRRSRVRSRFVEPGRGLGGDGVGTTTHCSMNS